MNKKSICLSLLCFNLFATDIIKEVEFNGLMHLSSEQALSNSGIKIGDEVDENNINNAVKKLFSYGFFDNISVKFSDSKLIFDVLEKPFIAKIDIKGVPSNDKKQIQNLINIKKGQAYDEKNIEEAKERISLYYQSRSFYDTVIEVDNKKLENNALVLEFNINRGEKIVINKINLVGAKKLKYSNFEPVIANKEKEFLGWFWGFNDGELKTLELINDPLRIKEEYLKKGYLDAQVSNAFLLASMQNYTAQLSYYIKEGNRYKIDDIKINNPLKEVKIDISDLKSTKGKYVNSEKVRIDIEYIKKIYQDLGYAFAQVEPKFNKNDDAQTLSLVFDIELGNKYKIKNVIISGNDKSLDKIIRRELYLTEGMQFNKTDLDDSVISLKKTGYFENVNITPSAVSSNELDLLVEVKEQSTGSISGGIGYSTSDGFLVNASVSDRNILGSGLYGGINLERSNKELTGRIFLKNPRIFDSRFALGGSLYSYTHDWLSYEEKSKGFDLDLSRDITRHLGAGIAYNLEQTSLKLYENVFLPEETEGRKLYSTITPYIYYDSTDDYYLPRRGIFAKLAFSYTGLGGDAKYQRLSTDFKAFYGFLDNYDIDVILRYRASFKKLFNTKEVPINSRLYLGGVSSIRGYESSTVSPKGRYSCSSGLCTYDSGGNISFNNSVEINFPISDKLKLRASIFYDFGMIGKKNLSEIKRQSTGISLDWNTPLGPLNFIFSKPIKKKAGDETNVFEFSIGSQF
ncbi:outer membrane protein assembly factor BamA [Campylobacter canadensis]|uniref:Outer membrane protein assembly factor BamA n=3 Tax=Campylobacter canadensis TaxID=449520 RepID=A0ABS7WVR1_9BACT|nr:outer membrane protein assembly factor BamA [Campylobacter canadensis]MBZ7988014.1 outer membrane protein assembly factor BamA [Campylobacter canadensis]MBZ7995441.1 outer membrane protein assembly factor BamA [Campylobacter canadensis]MBZ7998970.1 outer membrane protein assembly factor BamA [Campylobacter canadensis]MBZ8000796.1 outer membrane protein assembly factor BamA [Campylobacter canadensis]MBZ8002549.1 outer membrane protein assembly factor BamA [Campylobacter canadensis]